MICGLKGPGVAMLGMVERDPVESRLVERLLAAGQPNCSVVSSVVDVWGPWCAKYLIQYQWWFKYYISGVSGG